MKTAIMQPYLFPYIGYFQLINAVDVFVVYDDVNYIKQGWINRNNILVQNNSFLFTLPLKNPSSFKKINETLINRELYTKWKISFLKTLEQSYIKAPFFFNTFAIIEKILENDDQNISKFSHNSLVLIMDYLKIKTKLVQSSCIFNNDFLKSEERIIDICMKQNAQEYYNPIGGTELYSKENFSKNGIQLKFLKPIPNQYPQFKDQFVPYLSIIDVMMFNSPEIIQQMLTQYELV